VSYSVLFLNLPVIDLYEEFLPSQTYEGENTVLYLQLARYLIKSVQRASKGQVLRGSVSYISRGLLQEAGRKSSFTTLEDLSSGIALLDIIRHRAVSVLLQTAQLLSSKVSGGAPMSDAWNKITIDLVRAANAHSVFVYMQNFYDSIASIQCSASLKLVLQSLFNLFGCFWILRDTGDFLEDGHISRSQLCLIRQHFKDLLHLIRRDAVVLVDSWDFSDYTLNSALGRYDGNVYQALYDWAQEAPLNQKKNADGIQEFLLPTMRKPKPQFQSFFSKL
jgi:acyl-CoA oxidase